jgi:hypothetical protein
VTGTVATNISGQSVNVGNTVSVTGTVATNISGQSVNVGNTVSVTGTVATNISGQSVVVSNFPTVQTVSVSGVVSVTGTVATNISGQSVNVGNTVSVTGSVSVSNAALTVQTGTNVLDVNITGGTITGADGKAYLYSGNAVTPITATTVSAKSGIDSNIINTSIDTHCYASANGSTWHHLASDANGQLNVHSKTQDGAGTDITSTLNGAKQSLDVNVANTSVTVSGTVGLAAGSVIKISDGVDIADVAPLNAVMTTPNGLVTASALYGRNSANTQSQAITTTSTSGKQALDTYDYTAGFLLEGLQTLDAQIRDNTNSQLTLTLVTNGSLSDVNTTLTAINGKIPSGLGVSTVNTVSSLNVYSVQPKTLYYNIGGIDTINTAYRLIGGNPTATGNGIDTYNFSTGNARVLYATTTTGTPNTNLFIDYVNASGALVQNAGPYAIVATAYTTLPSIVSILSLKTSTTIGSIASPTHQLYISPATNTTTSFYHISIANYGVSVATVPTGYYGYISTLTASFEIASSLVIVKWGTDGIRIPIYKLNLPAGGTTTVTSGSDGYIGGILNAGESIGFTNNIAVVSKLVQASLVLKAL